MIPDNTALDRYLLFIFIFIAFALECIGICTSQKLSDCLQRILIFISIAAHIYFVIEVVVMSKKKLSCIAGCGKIDRNLCALLKETGVRLNSSGLVENTDRFRSLLVSTEMHQE